MRTPVLIDGYNFYYGCLQHSPYKWLNVRALVSDIIRVQQPKSQTTDVQFFSAPVIAKLALPQFNIFAILLRFYILPACLKFLTKSRTPL